MSGNSETALITGGNGNIGRLVADQLLARGQRVIKFDIPGTEPTETQAGEEIVSGDIRDTDLLKEIIHDHKPDTIYHLASLLSGSSEVNIVDTWAINATASFHLMNLALNAGVGTFLFSSTAASYGPVDEDPMPLDYAQWPESMYGATKVAVERMGVYFKCKHGLDFRCSRLPLVISPYAPETAVSAYPSIAFKAASQGKAFSFPVAPDTGVSSLFLDDIIDSVVALADADRGALTQHVYNLHGYFMTAQEVADTVKQHFPDFEYRFEPVENVDRLISQWPNIIDDSDARRDWNWNPAYDFAGSAQRMCELLKSGQL
ncbi:MAG: NAD-dependent epimerase/dehydratase family protein [Pseudomonadota bacterium]